MIVSSPSFQGGGVIPKKFTCDGGDMNPELQIQNVPSAAKSLALIVHDPDAPMVGGFYHWVVWNIDPATTVIKEESVPSDSMQGRNSGDILDYESPCPPPGDAHHYEFRLYALDTVLGLFAGATGVDLSNAMDGHILAEAKLVGLYKRD